jgi:hypothetical protein
VSSSASILSNTSRNTTSPTYSLFTTSQEQDNDERIQLIFDDINHIVENYTRELDDTLRSKTSNPLSSYRKTSTEQHHKTTPPPLPPKRQIGNYLDNYA